MKEDLRDLSDKYNNFERVFDNKLGFIESSLTKLLKEEGKQKEEKNIENKNIENKNIENKNIENKNIENKIIENKIAENNNNNNEIINKTNVGNIQNEDKKTWKEFFNFLENQFSEKKLKQKEIKKGDLDKFKKIALNLIMKGKLPEEKFNDFYKEKYGNRKEDELTMILLAKKTQIFEVLIELESKLRKKKEGGHKEHKEHKEKNTDVNKFDINKFRKEYNLSEEEFPDALLKQKYIECKGNEKVMFYKLLK